MRRAPVIPLVAVLTGLFAWSTPAAVGLATSLALPLRIVEPNYTLAINRSSLELTIMAPDGSEYTALPLAALAGAQSMPLAGPSHVSDNGSTLTLVVGQSSAPLETVVLHAYPSRFTVDFTVRPGPHLGAEPVFFYDGSTGIDVSRISAAYVPDPGVAEHSRLPDLLTDIWTPLAPPPLDLEMLTRAGWFGIGLIQVPDATEMRVTSDGALAINYPLAILHTIHDRGGGGRVAGGSVHFPPFLFNFSSTALDGLRAYHDGLVSLDAAPASPRAGPAWWRQPIADTWGEQVADGALRGSPAYTSAWVLRFVQEWRSRSGLSSFTVMIDSRWQQQLGSPQPDLTRFGGWSGMRSLIDQLHAQGLKVVLWWPMWGRGTIGRPDHALPGHEDRADALGPPLVVDPTTPAFPASTAGSMSRLLGDGPNDLDADGLKLDWAYNIPTAVSNPGLGWGDTLLFRYLSVLYTQAHLVRPDAYIESSAPSPQFARVADGVRLYDAWSEHAWEQRAAIVAAVDPGALIDGDDWQASAGDQLVHELTSSAYGVPASYYVSRWADHTPIPATLDQVIGAVMGIAADKGAGDASQLASGDWCYRSGDVVTAETLADRTALVVLDARAAERIVGQVVTIRSEEVTIPVFDKSPITLVASGAAGAPVATQSDPQGTTAMLRAGTVYDIVAATAPDLDPQGGCD